MLLAQLAEAVDRLLASRRCVARLVRRPVAEYEARKMLRPVLV